MASDLNISFKTTPFGHQLDEFTSHREAEARALLWEQGTGKTKLILDTVAWLYLNKKMTGLLIVAPNGVHENWLKDQFPQHYPLDEHTSVQWDSKRAATKAFQTKLRLMMENPTGLAVLTINYEAIITPKGKAAVERFMALHDVMMVCDESHRIKAMSAIRTKAIIKLGRYAKYRRILTGTVVGNSAFDLYSQFLFLNESILGFPSEYAFKNRFGIFVKTPAGNGRYFNQLVKYRNLDYLRKLINPHSSRVTKAEVLDLPDKLYVKRYFYMMGEQRKAYDTLKKEFLLEVEEGKILSAPLAITRLLRLQQITCNYLPLEGKMMPLSRKNMRIECLIEAIESSEGKIIIWARFTEDIVQIGTRLTLDKIEFVEYYGATSTTDRTAALEAFTQDPECKIFLANPACAGEGLNLHVATTVIYYSNSFKLIERLQSEDRAHRIGQEHNVTYIDIVCPDTVDENIVKALIEKRKIATEINGDNLAEWI